LRGSAGHWQRQLQLQPSTSLQQSLLRRLLLLLLLLLL
jgi:hypothetical protein